MKTYDVAVEVHSEIVLVVRAEDEDAAKQRALTLSERIDLSDRTCVVTDITEVTKEAAE